MKCILKYLIWLPLMAAMAALGSACSDSDDQVFVVAANGYIIQSFENVGDEGGKPLFTPYIYFRANEQIGEASVARMSGWDSESGLLPGNMRQGGVYHETDWRNTAAVRAVTGMYTISAMNSRGEEAFDYVIFEEITPLGRIEELEFSYRAPSARSAAMVSVRVANVENATHYVLQVMPHTPEYGYTRMNMPYRVFEPVPGDDSQLLVWMIPDNITDGYDKVMICAAAVRSENDTNLILEGEWREIKLDENRPAVDSVASLQTE